MTTRANYNIISSDKGCLNLTREEMEAYEKEAKELLGKYYRIQRKARGIWASNQNKYVATRAELKEWDSTFMEDTYIGKEE